MMGTIEIEQTKSRETDMNRIRLNSAASRNASGVIRNAGYPIGSSAGSKYGMRTSSKDTLRRRLTRLAFE
jgi:hypothetical protein